MRARPQRRIRLLKWFRRKSTEKQAPRESAAPVSAPEVTTAKPAGEADAQSIQRKRRRGSRGGRNRRKPAGARAEGGKDEPAAEKPKSQERTKPQERGRAPAKARTRQ